MVELETGEEFRVAGIYQTGNVYLDSGGAITLEEAQMIAGREGKVTMIPIYLMPGADKEQVLTYVRDLRVLLSKGTFVEQKAFLRSFIKRIDFEPRQVAIQYAIPVPMGGGDSSKREVLSIELNGSPIITFPHQKVETFFEVAIAHAPQGGRSELCINNPYLGG